MFKITFRNIAKRVKINERNLYNWKRNRKELLEVLTDFTALEELGIQNIKKTFREEEVKKISFYLSIIIAKEITKQVENKKTIKEIIYDLLMDLNTLKAKLFDAMIDKEEIRIIEIIKYKLKNNPLGVAEWYFLLKNRYAFMDDQQVKMFNISDKKLQK